MTSLVSILIPAYNAERWIADAIRSALDQTWPEKEIIIVDDGSKDRTLAVAQAHASAKVKVVSQPNQGASAARNHALSLCQGEFIQWLDADDLLAPDKIAAQMAVADATRSRRTLLSSAWCRFYYRPYQAAFTPNSLWEDLSPTEWMIRKFETNDWMAIESWLVSRDLTEAAGPWDSSLSLDDDGDYFSRIICASEVIRFVSGAKSYVRRSNSGSLSSHFLSRGKLESQFRSLRLQIQRLRALEDSDRVRRACITLLQRWLIYFYPEHDAMVSQARSLAKALGGELKPPELNWKYAIVQRLFGWTVAKKARFALPNAKARCVQNWEKLQSYAGH